ncbi:hypothetical protein JOM56_002493 [Amanita muscaria]
MSSPFAFGSPRIPAAPQSTPVTSSNSYFLNKPRAPRPPVVNPYDKFSQTEFDDWISNITGSLRKALGHETDEPDRTTVESDSTSAIFDQSPRGIHARQLHPNPTLSDEEQEEYETDEEGANDSLADIRARFTARLDKGKARDPMEGPGLPISGKGDKDAPIEIDLDGDESESDDDRVDQRLQDEDASVDSDILDDEEVALHLSFFQPSDEEDEEDAELGQWLLPQSSVGSEGDPKEGNEQREDEYDDESDEDEGSSSSEGRQGSDDVIELLYSDDEAVAQVSTAALSFVGEEEYSSSEGEREDIEVAVQEDRVEDDSLSFEREDSVREPVYEIGTAFEVEAELKEDIGEEDAEDDVEDEKEGTGDEGEGSEEEEAENEEEGDGDGSDEEHDQPQPSGMRRKPSPEIIDLDSDEEDQLTGDSDDIQPPELDTSFPPHQGDLQTPIEIRNPWLGPQTYAEDYYAGGPVFPQGPDVFHNPHILGVNDDREGFLTPEVVTPAESNEREASAGEELQLTHPRLHFVHSHSTKTWSEMPPEADFVAGAAPTVEVQNVEVEKEANAILTRDEGSSVPIIIEAQDESNNVANTDLAQEKEPFGSQEQFGCNDLLEMNDQYALPSQETVQDGEHDAVRQTGATLDEMYEEMDAEVARDSQAEQSHFQLEGVSDVSRPLHRKVPSVTVEDATDDEAENEYLKEGEDTWISPILPLGASDLSIEATVDDSRLIMPSDDVTSLRWADTELAVDECETKDSLSTAPEVRVEIADNGDSQTVSDVVEVATSELVESHISTTEALEPDDQSDQLPALLTNDLPATDFVDTAIESEPEQQQLPTPPAEQEVLPHHASMKHGSPETQPETLVEEDETQMESMTEEEALSQQDSKATLIGESLVAPPISIEKETPQIPSGDDEQESAYAPTDITITIQEKLSETLDLDEKMLDQQSVGQSEIISPDADVSPSVATSVPDVAIQDVTEDAVTMEVIDYLAVVEEIPSKAASEEPEFLDKNISAGTFSKEGSVISLSFSDGAGVSPGLSYLVEELPDDEVTDEDADGEVDPDLGITSMQDITSSRRWNDLADEIFDANLWDLGDPFFPPVPPIEPVEAGTDQSTVVCKENSVVCTTEQAEPVAVQENRLDSQLTLTGENPTETIEPESSSDPAADEDDIASSRETSPSPIAVEQPTRSPSPASLPQSSPSGSEKDLYGDKGGSTETQTHEVGLADETSPFTEDMTPDVGADDASTTIPGLTLTTSLRPTSPIPGLGARLLEDAGTEGVDSEIPGLTWSKTFPSLMTSNECSMPPRPASCPQTDISPSHSPLSLKQAHEWLMTHVPYTVTRRATEPVLFSDPYPYSLSTPGLDSAKDEVGDTEDDESQDMSMSSSSTSASAEKDSERDAGEPGLDTDGSIEGKLFVAASPVGGNKPEEAEPGLSQDLIEPVETIDEYFMNFNDADQDRDADGDLDPDFVVLHDIITGPSEKLTMLAEEPEEAPVAAPEAVDVSSDAREGTLHLPSEIATERPSEPQQPLSSPDTDILRDTATGFDLKVTNETVTLTFAPESTKLETDDAQTDNSRSKSLELPADEEFHLNPVKPTEVVQDTAIRSSPQSLSPPPQADEATGKRTSNGKRKRSPTPQPKVAAQAPISDQPNNAMKSKSVQSKRPKPSQRHDRTKRPRTASTMNGKPEHSDSDDSILSSELTAPSDDEASSIADGLLRGDSAESSRTPTAALSPATKNTAEHFYPMLHKHGRGAKNQSKQVLPSQRPIQRTQSAPSGSRSSPLASQRATRSNCRYRKISVPREEDGPRVCFLVPGCSLGDEEVVEDNEIEDLGEATYSDSLRMVRDIESLFDSYLIGVLRQLVGVDLLREQEVFYLPAPGEEPVVRKPRPKKSLSDKSSLSKRPSKSGNVDTSSVVSTPSRSVASTSFRSPSLSKAPVSHSSATSASVSAARKGSRYERDSLTPTSSLSLSSSDEEKELDDTERRPKHRLKHIHKVERGKHSEHPAKGEKIPKGGRRLTSDAMAYTPRSDSEDEPSTDDNATRFLRRTSVRRGLKRTRSGKSFAVPGEADGREAKKIKRDR